MKRFLIVGFAVFAGVMVLYMLEFHLLERHRQAFLSAFFTPSNKTKNINISRNSSRAAEAKSSEIPIDHYVAVSDPTFAGKTFEMDNETFRIVQRFLKENVFKRKPVKLNPKASYFDVVVPVSAASSNHFGELMRVVDHFPKHLPGVKLVCYNIGLSEPQIDILKNKTHVIYKKFEFEKYPPHIKNLVNYAWKLLLIGELLSAFDGVMWIDSSIRIYGHFDHILERMVHFNSGALFFLKIEGGHSIAMATDPKMIEYFPVFPKVGLTETMLPGGTILLFNTEDVQEHVMKWAAVCALVKDCIAPPGSRLYCPGGFWQTPREKYGGCHRYDQALLSLLVTNLYHNERERFSLNATEALSDTGFMG